MKTIDIEDGNKHIFINVSEQEINSKSVNVALAAAITSYVRIHSLPAGSCEYKFIVKYWDHLYYVYTDSLFLSIPLDPSEMSSEC